MLLPEFIHENQMKCQKKVLSDSNFAPSFVNHHSLIDINFDGNCLMKNYISIPKRY